MKIHCNYDKLVPVSQVVPNEKNTNQHPEKQVKLLAKLIDYQGWRHPIIVSNLSGLIVAGHGRLDAAKINGYNDVPVSYQDFENKAQEMAFLESDNLVADLAQHDQSLMIENIRELDLDDDFDLELFGMPELELPEVKMLDEEAEDDVPTDVETRCKEGDLWRLGEHRLLCGDSTNVQHVERLMGGDKADMVFTDPPYGIDICNRSSYLDGGKKGNMAASHNVYKHFQNEQDPQAARDFYNYSKTLEECTLIFWGANNYPEVLDQREGWIVWDKKEELSDTFSDCELAYTTYKKPVKKFKHIWKGMIKDSERGEKRVHPTQKPIALAEWCFENYGEPKKVLDGFGGSGSTLIACEKTNRKCFMMELDPHYCDVILTRWEKYTGKTAERVL